jgi:hypothetical protein
MSYVIYQLGPVVINLILACALIAVIVLVVSCMRDGDSVSLRVSVAFVVVSIVVAGYYWGGLIVASSWSLPWSEQLLRLLWGLVCFFLEAFVVFMIVGSVRESRAKSRSVAYWDSFYKDLAALPTTKEKAEKLEMAGFTNKEIVEILDIQIPKEEAPKVPLVQIEKAPTEIKNKPWSPLGDD